MYFSKCKRRNSVTERKIGVSCHKSSNLSTKSGSNWCVAKAIMLQGRDVGNCSDDSIVMADKEKKKQRGNYCVAGGPNMSNCPNNSSTPRLGISSAEEKLEKGHLNRCFPQS